MQQLFKSGFALKGDTANALRAELNKLDDDQPVKPDPQTFEAWVERWFAEYASRKRTPKTLERYRQLVAYALPDLGGVRLQDLSALMIEPVIFRLLKSGGRDRKTKKARPLSTKTVRHVASVLDVILKQAVKKKLRDSNPMQGVELPAVEPRESVALDAERLCWYLDVAPNTACMRFCCLRRPRVPAAGKCLPWHGRISILRLVPSPSRRVSNRPERACA